MNERKRNEDYAHVVGELSAEGRIHDEKTLKEALRLNPISPIEKSMKTKTDKELQKIGEELERAQIAFNEGYFEGMKKESLPPHEIKELKRRIRLVQSGVGNTNDLDAQKLELKVYILKLLGNGYKVPDNLQKQIQEATNGV